MNFGMAVDMAKDEGIEVEKVIINDDVGSGSKEEMGNRRGVAGEVVVWKAVGARTEEGASLKEVREVAEKVNASTRSMGVAHSPCAVPSMAHGGEPNFTLGEDEMEIGVGHHGEPGGEKVAIKSADETTEILMGKLLEDLPFQRGDEVSVLINGLGCTPLLELYIIYRKVAEILEERRISIHTRYIGEFFTSLEMGGYSVTLTKLDDELKRLLDAPAHSPLFVQS